MAPDESRGRANVSASRLLLKAETGRGTGWRGRGGPRPLPRGLGSSIQPPAFNNASSVGPSGHPGEPRRKAFGGGRRLQAAAAEEEGPWPAARGMAGNIVHAIATTNAIVSGLIVIQAVRILSNKKAGCDLARATHTTFINEPPAGGGGPPPEPPEPSARVVQLPAASRRRRRQRSSRAGTFGKPVPGGWRGEGEPGGGIRGLLRSLETVPPASPPPRRGPERGKASVSGEPRAEGDAAPGWSCAGARRCRCAPASRRSAPAPGGPRPWAAHGAPAQSRARPGPPAPPRARGSAAPSAPRGCPGLIVKKKLTGMP